MLATTDSCAVQFWLGVLHCCAVCSVRCASPAATPPPPCWPAAGSGTAQARQHPCGTQPCSSSSTSSARCHGQLPAAAWLPSCGAANCPHCMHCQHMLRAGKAQGAEPHHLLAPACPSHILQQGLMCASHMWRRHGSARHGLTLLGRPQSAAHQEGRGSSSPPGQPQRQHTAA
jgi:hypothetical protein